LEDKGNMAFLQLKMKCPVLETHIALNSAAVLQWAEKRWEADEEPKSVFTLNTMGSGQGTAVADSNTKEKIEADWWVVKASRGNGGKDIWIMHSGNFRDVVQGQGLPAREELVIQRYVHSPLLVEGKKFHYRCYALLMADMSAYMYRHGYILRAGLDYHCSGAGGGGGSEGLDLCRHISNLSVNKHIPGHPGQVPCCLAEEQPAHYAQICNIWREVAVAAEPFLRHQSSRNHFEFYGIDVLVDSGTGGADPTCWLIEINRLPGLESSAQNKAVEDVFYNKMMLQVLRRVTRPIRTSSSADCATEESADDWDEVAPPQLGDGASSACWKNLFQWKAFTRKNRGAVVL
jgi:hypothetical protein